MGRIDKTGPVRLSHEQPVYEAVTCAVNVKIYPISIHRRTIAPTLNWFSDMLSSIYQCDLFHEPSEL